MNKRAIGAESEERAGEYLEKLGIRILEKNFTTKIGEIDIIAKDGDTTVFIEVKFRRTDRMGRPFESVTYGKQMKIQRVAMLYAQKHHIFEKPMRFDVIEILDAEIIWMKNAFEIKNNKWL